MKKRPNLSRISLKNLYMCWLNSVRFGLEFVVIDKKY